VETVMTMEVVDDLTRTKNDKPRQQIFAMSLANLVAGLLGTLGGAALIPETVFGIVVAGANGRYRISGIVASLVVFIFIMYAQAFINLIPLASIVGVMLIVVFHIFDWSSLPIIVASFLPNQIRTRVPYLRKRKVNRFDAGVIVVVTIVVVTVNLFVAVLAGVLLTSAAIVWHSGENIRIKVRPPKQEENATNIKVYVVQDALLFSASKRFIAAFDPENDPDRVEVLFETGGLALQDFSAIHALNVVGKRYEDRDKSLVVRGLDELSLRRLDKADTLRKYFTVGSNRDLQDEEAKDSVLNDESDPSAEGPEAQPHAIGAVSPVSVANV
jgi:SulP family sulfate permease